MTQFDFDLFVIGAGSGGVRAARLAANRGKRVAVAEESRVGGTCVMRGCVPKKLLVYAGQFANGFDDSAGFGWSLSAPPRFDWTQLITAKNTELRRLEGVYRNLLNNSGVTVLDGLAVMADAHTIEMGSMSYTAENILIATGGWPHMPKIPGIEHAITSNEALDLLSLPQRMVIVGGGYIAVEFASIFNSLGVDITQIIRGDAFLRGFDQDVRTTLTGAMIHRGITLVTKTTVTAITKVNNGYRLSLSDGTSLETDLVMYATGRHPNTAGLGFEQAGIHLRDDGAVVVNDYSRTSLENVYAVGDATERMALTPVALAEAEAVIHTLYDGKATRPDYDFVPTAVFSSPPVATVGLDEAKAVARFDNVHVYLSRFRPMRNTLAGRDERTMMKMLVDPDSDMVLGIHMVGDDAAEIMQGFAVALKCGATKEQIDSTIGIHPSAAEELVTMRTRRE